MLTKIDVRNEKSKLKSQFSDDNLHYIKLIWESPTTEDTISTVTNARFIQNSDRMANNVDLNSKFSERIFSIPAILIKATSMLFGWKGSCFDDQNWLDFPAFSLQFIEFAVQFCLRCKFSISFRSIQAWRWRDFPSHFCIANVKWLFCVYRSGQRPDFKLYWKILK